MKGSCVHGSFRMLQNRGARSLQRAVSTRKKILEDGWEGRKGFLQKGCEAHTFPSLTVVWMTEPRGVPVSLCWDPC